MHLFVLEAYEEYAAAQRVLKNHWWVVLRELATNSFVSAEWIQSEMAKLASARMAERQAERKLIDLFRELEARAER